MISNLNLQQYNTKMNKIPILGLEVGDVLIGKYGKKGFIHFKPPKEEEVDPTVPKTEETWEYENRRLGRKIQEYKSSDPVHQFLYHADYISARHRLTRLNEGLAKSETVIGAYLAIGLDREEVIQEAQIGIFEGTNDFKPNLGKFSDYITYHIKKRLNRLVFDRYRKGFHIPVNVAQKWRKVTEVEMRLTDRNGREPTFQEIAEEYNRDRLKEYLIRTRKNESQQDNTEHSQEEIDNILKRPRKGNEPYRFKAYHIEGLKTLDSISSMSHAYRESGEDGELEVEKPDSSVPPIEDIIVNEDLEKLRSALPTLDTLEHKIIDLRHGLSGGPHLNFVEIGKQLGYTRQNIIHHYGKALDKLRGFIR